VTVEPEKSRTIDRHVVFDFAKQRSLLVCPFSVGQPITFLETSCSPEAMSKLGKNTVEYFDQNDFYKEAIRCSPLMGIHSSSYNPENPVLSYLIYNKSEKFDPVKVRSNDNDFDRKLRQFLNNVGAPVVYYNVMSNVICLSVPTGEKFSLVDELHEFGFPLPSTALIETSTSSCANWVKERFNALLSDPILGQ
jgi:hypothetical protein